MCSLAMALLSRRCDHDKKTSDCDLVNC
jgi:hypothetical protein